MLITFDDGYADWYTNALPALQAAGLTATGYVTADFVDSAPQYLTTTQLQALVSAGWSVANHSKTHPNFTTLNDAQDLAELQASITALTALGCNAPLHMAYPGGNPAAVSAMQTAGMLSGRMITDAYLTIQTLSQYAIPSKLVFNDTPVATVKSWIDETVAQRKVMTLCFHQIVTPADGTYKVSVEDFTEICNYLAASGATVVNIQQLWSIYQIYD